MKCGSTDKITRWQSALIHAVTDPRELFELLELDQQLLPDAIAADQLFSLKVPRGFIHRMKKGDINDPLLRQVLPLKDEFETVNDFTQDPLQEKNANPHPGLLHKYQGRALVTLVGVCAINCRYCFRRHFSYEENNPGKKGWENIFDYIAKDPSIHEIILSGGDPLIVGDSLLKNFIQEAEKISHVQRLRIHSRVPIVLPERVTNELIDAITHPRLKTIMVTHSNHPQEINHEVKEAMQFFLDAKISLLNQTVLLKGVNDDADTLVALSEALFDAGILPYYLHVLDKVDGAAHFDLNRDRARELHNALIQRLSGYLVPKLVWEKPGAPSKISLAHTDFYTV